MHTARYNKIPQIPFRSSSGEATNFKVIGKVISLRNTGRRCENTISIPNKNILPFCNSLYARNPTVGLAVAEFELIFTKTVSNDGDRFWFQARGKSLYFTDTPSSDVVVFCVFMNEPILQLNTSGKMGILLLWTTITWVESWLLIVFVEIQKRTHKAPTDCSASLLVSFSADIPFLVECSLLGIPNIQTDPMVNNNRHQFIFHSHLHRILILLWVLIPLSLYIFQCNVPESLLTPQVPTTTVVTTTVDDETTSAEPTNHTTHKSDKGKSTSDNSLLCSQFVCTVTHECFGICKIVCPMFGSAHLCCVFCSNDQYLQLDPHGYLYWLGCWFPWSSWFSLQSSSWFVSGTYILWYHICWARQKKSWPESCKWCVDEYLLNQWKSVQFVLL